MEPERLRPPLRRANPGLGNMKRALLIAFTLAGCTQPAPFAFTNASIHLPDTEPKLPSGPDVALVEANCLACHSADMMTNQPALGAKGWAKTIAKMREVYKAQIRAEDEPKIVAYLVNRPAETATPRP